MLDTNYDLVVVGGGHAGAEAAAAAARRGVSTLMITMNLQNIGQMSCNPAMGGIAKGQIIREIDALGGFSGVVSDKSAIQFRMLNRSKGPAMWSPRSQNDRMRFAEEWRLTLEGIAGLDFLQDTVVDLIEEGGRMAGVVTGMGLTVRSRAVVVTSGTFLNGLLHIGEKNFGGGRAGEKASYGITERLVDWGFKSGRMKTGTPPRVDGRSLDYSQMEEQRGDVVPDKFSFSPETSPLEKQRSCWITYTNPLVHELLREGFDRSPMFNGSIQSTGPRYCPSIEDKIHRFKDKDQHQIFAEPEGWKTVEVYVNGFSTSLPQEVQAKAIRSIKGFENVRIFRPGYAIEYDFFPPTQLKQSLETKIMPGLFFAGQINGTTGYEEAACQGLMAGINAAAYLKDEEPLVLKRDEAYIGVLIDDLVHKGTEEPYRMFTSRAEYRILLRQDNADQRLLPIGFCLGLQGDAALRRMERKRALVAQMERFCQDHSVDPSEFNDQLAEKGLSLLKQKTRLSKLLARPQLGLKDFEAYTPLKKQIAEIGADASVLEQVEIRSKYAGYIEKEKENAAKINRLDDVPVPKNFDYHKLSSMSLEAREKLSKFQPSSIGQAKAVSGVSPADISVLLVFMGR